MRQSFVRHFILVMMVCLSCAAGQQVVTKTADTNDGTCDADCSLREAIANAADGDTITFDASLSGGTITLTSGELGTGLANLTIDASTLANPVTVDADNNSRVFHHTGNGTFEIVNLEVTGGNLTGLGLGGGIRSNGDVTLTNSTISSNSAFHGGGILSFGDVTLSNSTISDNSANLGGGIRSVGDVTLTNSTISGNEAGDGGGIFSQGAVTVTNSTISGNLANGEVGGGIRSRGDVTLNNSTISSNSADNLGGGIASNGTVTLNNSLVLGNDAPTNPQIVANGGITLNNSAYGFTAGESTGDSFVGFGIDDVFTNPVAAASAPTTAGDYTLKACSPAINAGNNGNALGGIDLAGNTRIQQGTVDMGAFESTLKACQTIDFDLSTLPIKAVGDADFDISGFASASSGLAVTFSSATTGVCTVAGSTVTILAVGTCTINADQAGNAEYQAAPQVQQSFTVNAPVTDVVNKRDDTNDGRCDTADCSLREAIANAADGDTITFDVSGTINLNSTLDVPQDDLTIDASGQNVVVSGQNSHRVFHHTGNGTFEIVNLEVTEGSTTGNGGGIFSRGNVTLSNSTISGNSADVGGGIAGEDTVTLNNSTISGNLANGEVGGGIRSRGDVTLNNSTISSNSADNLGGGIASDGDVTLNNSIISGNSADLGGGITSSNVTVTNSAISGNSADQLGGGIASPGTVTVNNSTISGNSADQGGGIFSSGNVTLNNSLVLGNDAPTNPQIFADGGITFNNSAYGLAAGQSIDDSFVGLEIDDVFTNPVAAARTPTTTGDYTLTNNSPAINAGDNALATGTTDLAGNDRIQQGTVDMGAYEFGNLGGGSVINPDPDLQIRAGATTAAASITSGSVVNIGAFNRGEVATVDFLIRNPGAQVLELGKLSLPSFLSNAGESLPETLASFGSALLTLSVDTGAAGALEGEFSLVSNDPDEFENPFVFTVTGNVSDTPANALNILLGVDLGDITMATGDEDVVLLSFKLVVPEGSVAVTVDSLNLAASNAGIERANNLRLYIDGGTRGVLDNRDVFVSSTTDTEALMFTFPARTFSPNVPMWFIVVGDF